jgi:hypothetical protein
LIATSSGMSDRAAAVPTPAATATATTTTAPITITNTTTTTQTTEIAINPNNSATNSSFDFNDLESAGVKAIEALAFTYSNTTQALIKQANYIQSLNANYSTKFNDLQAQLHSNSSELQSVQQNIFELKDFLHGTVIQQNIRLENRVKYLELILENQIAPNELLNTLSNNANNSNFNHNYAGVQSPAASRSSIPNSLGYPASQQLLSQQKFLKGFGDYQERQQLVEELAVRLRVIEQAMAPQQLQQYRHNVIKEKQKVAQIQAENERKKDLFRNQILMESGNFVAEEGQHGEDSSGKTSSPRLSDANIGGGSDQEVAQHNDNSVHNMNKDWSSGINSDLLNNTTATHNKTSEFLNPAVDRRYLEIDARQPNLANELFNNHTNQANQNNQGLGTNNNPNSPANSNQPSPALAASTTAQQQSQPTALPTRRISAVNITFSGQNAADPSISSAQTLQKNPGNNELLPTAKYSASHVAQLAPELSAALASVPNVTTKHPLPAPMAPLFSQEANPVDSSNLASFFAQFNRYPANSVGNIHLQRLEEGLFRLHLSLNYVAQQQSAAKLHSEQFQQLISAQLGAESLKVSTNLTQFMQQINVLESLVHSALFDMGNWREKQQKIIENVENELGNKIDFKIFNNKWDRIEGQRAVAEIAAELADISERNVQKNDYYNDLVELKGIIERNNALKLSELNNLTNSLGVALSELQNKANKSEILELSSALDDLPVLNNELSSLKQFISGQIKQQNAEISAVSASKDSIHTNLRKIIKEISHQVKNNRENILNNADPTLCQACGTSKSLENKKFHCISCMRNVKLRENAPPNDFVTKGGGFIMPTPRNSSENHEIFGNLGSSSTGTPLPAIERQFDAASLNNSLVSTEIKRPRTAENPISLSNIHNISNSSGNGPFNAVAEANAGLHQGSDGKVYNTGFSRTQKFVIKNLNNSSESKEQRASTTTGSLRTPRAARK